MAAEHPHLAVPGLTVFPPLGPVPGPAPSLSGPIAYPIQDFYLTNPIARASPTLQRCSAEILHGQDFAEAAEVKLCNESSPGRGGGSPEG
jgi:NADH-quinone oxidoreductase subunit G